MARNASAARRGNQALAGLKQNLRKLPLSVAADVASRASPAMTTLARGAHSSRVGTYQAEPYPIGADGRQLTLRRTGAVAGSLRFVTIGTVVKCELRQSYAKFLIGKYNILPNGFLPVGWKRKLDAIVAETKVAL